MSAQRRVSAECASDLVLDQLLLDELDEQAAASCRAHFDRCGACAERFEALRQDQLAFQTLGASKLSAMTAPAPRAARRSRAWFAVVPLAAAALALGSARLIGDRTPERLQLATAEPPSTGLRSKGSSFELLAVVERGDHQFRAFSGDAVRAGDQLQLAYSAAERGVLYVVGVDGTQRATPYYPEPGAPQFVEPGQEVELPFSLVLDQTRGPERFFAFLCAAPTDPSSLARAAEAAAADGAGAALSIDGCAVRYLELDKP